MNDETPEWRKSTRSGVQENCVEVTVVGLRRDGSTQR